MTGNSQPLLTIFAAPKAFRPPFDVIQRNAIGSWVRLGKDVRIILMGDEEGIAEATRDLGLPHIPHVERNEYGTPLLNSLFEKARRASNSRLLCFINCDIMLTSDLLKAIRRIPFRRFLMVGRRWDIEIDGPWDFESAQWETELRGLVDKHGKPRVLNAIDYFVFTRDMYRAVPAFAIGRAGYDNWLVYEGRQRRVPVVDASEVVLAVHQNHDYSHHREGLIGTRRGPEAKRNVELRADPRHSFTIADSTWVLKETGLLPAWTVWRLLRRLSSMQVLYPRAAPALEAVKMMLALVIRACSWARSHHNAKEEVSWLSYVETPQIRERGKVETL